jgi:flagellar export protein FliJ
MAAPYRFRLATVLKVRRIRLHEQQRQVAERRSHIARLEGRKIECADAIATQIEAARGGLRNTSLSVEQALWDRQYLTRLRMAAVEIQRSIDQHAMLLGRERQALAEAHKRVRALEQLEERQRAAYDTGVRRSEQRAEDERAIMQAARNDAAQPGVWLSE